MKQSNRSCCCNITLSECGPSPNPAPVPSPYLRGRLKPSRVESERTFKPSDGESATVQPDRHQSRKCNGRMEEETTHYCSFTLLLCTVFVQMREHHFASVVILSFQPQSPQIPAPHLWAFSWNGQINTFTFRLFARIFFCAFILVAVFMQDAKPDVCPLPW